MQQQQKRKKKVFYDITTLCPILSNTHEMETQEPEKLQKRYTSNWG